MNGNFASFIGAPIEEKLREEKIIQIIIKGGKSRASGGALPTKGLV